MFQPFPSFMFSNPFSCPSQQMTTFCFSIVPPALQTPTYLNQGFDPCVTLENEHVLNFTIMPPALETRPSMTCLNREIDLHIVLKTAEGTFINSPALGTAEESSKESVHPTTSIVTSLGAVVSLAPM